MGGLGRLVPIPKQVRQHGRGLRPTQGMPEVSAASRGRPAPHSQELAALTLAAELGPDPQCSPHARHTPAATTREHAIGQSVWPAGLLRQNTLTSTDLSLTKWKKLSLKPAGTSAAQGGDPD